MHIHTITKCIIIGPSRGDIGRCSIDEFDFNEGVNQHPHLRERGAPAKEDIVLTSQMPLDEANAGAQNSGIWIGDIQSVPVIVKVFVEDKSNLFEREKSAYALLGDQSKWAPVRGYATWFLPEMSEYNPFPFYIGSITVKL